MSDRPISAPPDPVALADLILDACRDVGTEGARLVRDTGPDAVLIGPGGLLDSLGLVALVIAVENLIADTYGVRLTLADERALSQQRSPFRTVRRLAEYAATRLAAENGKTEERKDETAP